MNFNPPLEAYEKLQNGSYRVILPIVVDGRNCSVPNFSEIDLGLNCDATYSTTTLNGQIAVIVSFAGDVNGCGGLQGAGGLNSTIVIVIAVVAVTAAILVVGLILYFVKPIRSKLFPFRERQRYVMDPLSTSPRPKR